MAHLPILTLILPSLPPLERPPHKSTMLKKMLLWVTPSQKSRMYPLRLLAPKVSLTCLNLNPIGHPMIFQRVEKKETHYYHLECHLMASLLALYILDVLLDSLPSPTTTMNLDMLMKSLMA